LLPRLPKPAFIDDQDGRLGAEVLQCVGTQVIAHPIGIPHGTCEQALHAVWTPFSGVFSQLPPVFAFGLTQDALQVRQRPTAWLCTSKASSNACMQTHKLLPPTADIRGCRLGSRESDMLGVLHGLLLSSEVAEDGRSTHSVPHERKEVLKRFAFFGSQLWFS
jgi:hypothetical protein